MAFLLASQNCHENEGLEYQGRDVLEVNSISPPDDWILYAHILDADRISLKSSNFDKIILYIINNFF